MFQTPLDATNSMPKFEVASKIQLKKADQLFQEKARRAIAVGGAAHVEGPVLYYPFGGADAITAFSLSAEITDVIIHSKEEFGNLFSLEANLKMKNHVMNSLDDLFANSQGWQTSIHLRRVANDYKGMGIALFTELFGIWRREPSGLYYFNINKIGIPAFDPQGRHAVIEFIDEGVKKRLWFFSHLIDSYEIGIPDNLKAFLAKADIDTLLIKGMHSLWSNHSPAAFIEFALNPARGALVIADSNSTRQFASRPIWKPGAEVTHLDLEFGYNTGVDIGTEVISHEDLRRQDYREMIGKEPYSTRFYHSPKVSLEN